MREDPSERWRITLFNRLSAEKCGHKIERFQTQKTALLFAYLSLNPGRNYMRELLCDTIWPYSMPDAARGSLNQAIAWIRKCFEDHDVLRTDRVDVAINYDAIEVDVEQFRILTTQNKQPVASESRRSNLVQAVSLYSDDLLKGINEPWVRVERLLLAGKYVKALIELESIDEASDDLTSAIQWQKELTRVEPHEEEHHARLMKLYSDMHDHGAIRRHFAELKQDFQQQGRSPSNDLKSLVDQLLNEPRPATQAPITRGIPYHLTRFYGRTEQINLVSDLLKSGSRLVSLIGLPGIGKTRLAAEIARRMDDCIDEITFTSLIDVPSSNPITTHLGHTFGLEPEPSATMMQRLVAKLSGDDKRLIVLDSFEHIVETGVNVVKQIVESCPHVAFLITSQIRLGLSGEIAITIDPLPVPSIEDGVEQMSENPSYSLLLDRIRTVLPNFEPNKDEKLKMSELCRKLEGFPLALELAAARVETQPIESIVDDLEHGFDTLAGHSVDIPERHRSLGKSFEHCFALFAPEHRQLLKKLAVFHGGWTWNAANHVLDVENAEELAKGLLACGLVTLRPPHKHSSDRRFDMLDLLRHFCREEGDSADDSFLRQRHAEFYVDLAERSKVEAVGSNHLRWAVRMREEQTNIEAALSFLESEGRYDLCLRMALGLGWLWMVEGNFDENANRVSRYLSHGHEGVDQSTLAHAYRRLALLKFMGTDLDQAEQSFEQALIIDEELQIRESIVADLCGLASVSIRRHDLARAKELLERSIELSEGLDLARRNPASHLYLAFVFSEMGEYDLAKAQFEQCQKIESDRGNAIGVAQTYVNLSIWAAYQQRFGLAAHYARESLRMFESFDQKPGIARSSMSLSHVLIREGKLDEACPYLDRALLLFDQLGDPLAIRACLSGLVEIRVQRGMYTDAARLMAIEAVLTQRLGARRSPVEEKEFDAICRAVIERVDTETREAFLADASLLNYHQIAAFARKYASLPICQNEP